MTKPISFDLESIISKPADKAPMITLTGDPGIGKTSMAALFPAPIFIQAEAGMDAIPDEIRPKAFPRVTSVFPKGDIDPKDFSNLQRALAAVLKAKHGYKTLVIDSITSLSRMIEKEIIAEEPNARNQTMAKAHGGYGKAYTILAERLSFIRDVCEQIRDERGMAIVFISHSDSETYDPPDGEPYTRHALQIHKKARGPFVDGVDLLAYMTMDVMTKGGDGEKTKAVSTGQRLLRCTANASSDAKNRYDIEGDIPVVKGKNPLLDYIPALMQYGSAAQQETQQEAE